MCLYSKRYEWEQESRKVRVVGGGGVGKQEEEMGGGGTEGVRNPVPKVAPSE